MTDDFFTIPIDVDIATINRIRHAAEAVGETMNTYIAKALEDKLGDPAPIVDYSRWPCAHKYATNAGALVAIFPDLLRNDFHLASLVARVNQDNKEIGEIMQARMEAQRDNENDQ